MLSPKSKILAHPAAPDVHGDDDSRRSPCARRRRAGSYLSSLSKSCKSTSRTMYTSSSTSSSSRPTSPRRRAPSRQRQQAQRQLEHRQQQRRVVPKPRRSSVEIRGNNDEENENDEPLPIRRTQRRSSMPSPSSWRRMRSHGDGKEDSDEDLHKASRNLTSRDTKKKISAATSRYETLSRRASARMHFPVTRRNSGEEANKETNHYSRVERRGGEQHNDKEENRENNRSRCRRRDDTSRKRHTSASPAPSSSGCETKCSTSDSSAGGNGNRRGEVRVRKLSSSCSQSKTEPTRKNRQRSETPAISRKGRSSSPTSKFQCVPREDEHKNVKGPTASKRATRRMEKKTEQQQQPQWRKDSSSNPSTRNNNGRNNDDSSSKPSTRNNNGRSNNDAERRRRSRSRNDLKVCNSNLKSSSKNNPRSSRDLNRSCGDLRSSSKDLGRSSRNLRSSSKDVNRSRKERSRSSRDLNRSNMNLSSSSRRGRSPDSDGEGDPPRDTIAVTPVRGGSLPPPRRGRRLSENRGDRSVKSHAPQPRRKSTMDEDEPQRRSSTTGTQGVERRRSRSVPPLLSPAPRPPPPPPPREKEGDDTLGTIRIKNQRVNADVSVTTKKSVADSKKGKSTAKNSTTVKKQEETKSFGTIRIDDDYIEGSSVVSLMTDDFFDDSKPYDVASAMDDDGDQESTSSVKDENDNEKSPFEKEDEGSFPEEEDQHLALLDPISSKKEKKTSSSFSITRIRTIISKKSPSKKEDEQSLPEKDDESIAIVAATSKKDKKEKSKSTSASVVSSSRKEKELALVHVDNYNGDSSMVQQFVPSPPPPVPLRTSEKKPRRKQSHITSPPIDVSAADVSLKKRVPVVATPATEPKKKNTPPPPFQRRRSRSRSVPARPRRSVPKPPSLSRRPSDYDDGEKSRSILPSKHDQLSSSAPASELFAAAGRRSRSRSVPALQRRSIPKPPSLSRRQSSDYDDGEKSRFILPSKHHKLSSSAPASELFAAAAAASLEVPQYSGVSSSVGYPTSSVVDAAIPWQPQHFHEGFGSQQGQMIMAGQGQGHCGSVYNAMLPNVPCGSVHQMSSAQSVHQQFPQHVPQHAPQYIQQHQQSNHMQEISMKPPIAAPNAPITTIIAVNDHSDDKSIRSGVTMNSTATGVRRQSKGKIEKMSYTDPLGQSGLYTGETNDDGLPHGNGKMKYDNGIFYTGTWANGSQGADSLRQRERILSGFTSWRGRGNTSAKDGANADPNRTEHVYGMEWIDLMGRSGRYTGTMDKNNIPNGMGVMKYDFGLIAEGNWVQGVLNDGAGGGGGGATVAGGTIVGGGIMGGGGMSVAPMSVGPGMMVPGGGTTMGGMTFAPGMNYGGGMSVGPGMVVGGGMSVGPGMNYGGAVSVGPGMNYGGAVSVGPGMVVGGGGPSVYSAAV